MTLHRIRICKCGHEESLHDGNGCSYGYDSVHGKCECERFRSRKALGKRRVLDQKKPTTMIDAMKAAAEFLTLAISLHEAEAKKRETKSSHRETTPAKRETKSSPRETNRPGPGLRKILIVVAQHPEGVTRSQIAVTTGYRRSTRDAYIHRLRSAGHVEQRGETILVTDAGKQFLGSDYKPLPTGMALRKYWLDTLPEGEAKIFEIVVRAFPKSVSRDDLTNSTNFKRSTRDAYIHRLAARKLLVVARGDVGASRELFQ